MWGGGHHRAIRNADQVEPRRANATAWQDNLYAAGAENEFCFRVSRFLNKLTNRRRRS